MCLLPIGRSNSLLQGNSRVDFGATDSGTQTKLLLSLAIILNLGALFIQGMAEGILFTLILIIIVIYKNSCCGLYLLILSWMSAIALLTSALNFIMDLYCRRGAFPEKCYYSIQFKENGLETDLPYPTWIPIQKCIGFILVIIFSGECGFRAYKEIEAQTLEINAVDPDNIENGTTNTQTTGGNIDQGMFNNLRNLNLDVNNNDNDNSNNDLQEMDDIQPEIENNQGLNQGNIDNSLQNQPNEDYIPLEGNEDSNRNGNNDVNERRRARINAIAEARRNQLQRLNNPDV